MTYIFVVSTLLEYFYSYLNLQKGLLLTLPHINNFSVHTFCDFAYCDGQDMNNHLKDIIDDFDICEILLMNHNHFCILISGTSRIKARCLDPWIN